MKIWMSLFKRELKAYFFSVIGYVVTFVFAFVSGNIFRVFLTIGSANIGGLMLEFVVLVVFICPFLAVRLFAEEKTLGTHELLFTYPISSFELVTAKFFSVFVFYLFILFPVFIYAIFLDWMSFDGIDVGLFAVSYLGLVLFGATLISIGVFTSSVTHSQITAGIAALGISVLLLIIHVFSSSLEGQMQAIVSELSLINHYLDFQKGILDSRHVIYFLCWISSMLFLTTKMIDLQRG